MAGKIIDNPVYRALYRGTVNAANGRTKAAAHQYTRAWKLGKENPAQTKLLIKPAVNDCLTDVDRLSLPDERLFKAITAIKVSFLTRFNKKYRQAAKEFNEEYKNLYPNTYKKRNKIIKEGKVSIKSNSTSDERINLFKPDKQEGLF